MDEEKNMSLSDKVIINRIIQTICPPAGSCNLVGNNKKEAIDIRGAVQKELGGKWAVFVTNGRWDGTAYFWKKYTVLYKNLYRHN